MKMKIRLNPHGFVAAALFATLTVSLTGRAWAQQATDNGMPQIQRQGEIEFVSGGVGADESHALERARSQWPLGLNFTGSGSDYLADVQVRIVDSHNVDVLNTTSQGPYMLVRLRPGQYTVHASYKGNEQSKAVTVPAKGSTGSTFHWSSQ
jgi:hypothetical protein